MTDTDQLLTLRVNALEEEIQKLRIELFGDQENQELYRKNRANNVTPNIPAPPLGVVEMLLNTATNNIRDTANLGRDLTGLRGEVNKRLEWAERVQKLLGPLFDEATGSQLGWAHVATKEYVDKGLERLAGALRGEFSAAVTFVKDLTKQLRDVKGHSGSPVMDMFWLYVRVRAEADRQEEAAKRPSRVQSLVHALTGYSKSETNGSNGAQR